MEKAYQVSIYGKKGCNKCKILKDRLEKLLTKDDWQDFSLYYHGIDTEDGLVSFAQNECLNPQRIPSFLVEKMNSSTGRYEPLLNPEALDGTKRMRPWRFIGIETDYSEKGKGIIRPEMITTVLQQAKEL